jgi:hypothetical protein
MNLIAGHTHCEALLGLHRSLSREVDALTPAKQL